MRRIAGLSLWVAATLAHAGEEPAEGPMAVPVEEVTEVRVADDAPAASGATMTVEPTSTPTAPPIVTRGVLPPGTPPEFAGMRPRPPYARWPSDVPVYFASKADCDTYFKEVAPGAMGRTIRRFDAVYRRCEMEEGQWVYRESHAYATGDPILDPVLLAVPPAVLLADWIRLRDSAGRAAERWDLTGTQPDKRQATWEGAPSAPVRGMRAVGDAVLGLSYLTAATPIFMTEGNGRGTDALIMTEVITVTAGITGSINLRNAEPMPLVDSDLRAWDERDRWRAYDELQTNRVYRSAVSAHTAQTAASMFGAATLGAMHHPDKPVGAQLVPFIAAAGFTALQGTAQVMSLRADPGDVLGGILVGTATGVLVPLSHAAIAKVIDPVRLKERREKRGRVTMVPVAGPGAVGVVGRW